MAERTLTIEPRHEWRIWRSSDSATEQQAIEHGYEPFAGYVHEGNEVILLRKLIEVSPATVVPLKMLRGGNGA